MVSGVSVYFPLTGGTYTQQLVVGLRGMIDPCCKWLTLCCEVVAASFQPNMGSVVKPHQTVVYLSVVMAMLWCDVFMQ